MPRPRRRRLRGLPPLRRRPRFLGRASADVLIALGTSASASSVILPRARHAPFRCARAASRLSGRARACVSSGRLPAMVRGSGLRAVGKPTSREARPRRERPRRSRRPDPPPSRSRRSPRPPCCHVGPVLPRHPPVARPRTVARERSGCPSRPRPPAVVPDRRRSSAPCPRRARARRREPQRRSEVALLPVWARVVVTPRCGPTGCPAESPCLPPFILTPGGPEGRGVGRRSARRRRLPPRGGDRRRGRRDPPVRPVRDEGERRRPGLGIRLAKRPRRASVSSHSTAVSRRIVLRCRPVLRPLARTWTRRSFHGVLWPYDACGGEQRLVPELPPPATRRLQGSSPS